MTSEEAAALFGKATYTSDRFQHAAVAVFVRSWLPCAEISRIDTHNARVLPGVLGVWCAQDLEVNQMPATNPLIGTSLPGGELMASRKIGWLGQPLAVVLASSLLQAQDAAEAIEVQLEAIELAEEDQPEAFCFSQGLSQAALGADLSEHVTVHWQHAQPRVAACALEPRAIRLSWDPQASRLLCWAGSQAPVRLRDHLAQVCKLKVEQVRVLSDTVGGAFGAKASATPEELVLAQIAMQSDQAVFWQASRSEELLSAPHGRGSRIVASMTARPDGMLIGLNAQMSFDVGYWHAYSSLVPAHNAVRILPGPYCIEHVWAQAKVHRSARTATSIYRGAGRPEAAMVTEVLIEKLARQLSLDPVELRRKHLIRPDQGPVVRSGGHRIDAANYPALLERACEMFGYQQRKEAVRERRERGEPAGIGTALYVEPCGQGFEWARVRWVQADIAKVYCGSPAQGQHHASMFANLVATELGLRAASVTVVLGDTDECPEGIGALASRSTAIGGSAVVLAARQVVAQRRAGDPFPIEATVRYEARHEAWSSGCVMAQVAIDADTGEPKIEALSWVDDAGELLDYESAQGQLLGGAAQGLGQALFEAVRFDEHGQLLTGSLMDYCMPRAADCPAIDLHGLPTRSDANLLGVRGVGEAGCIGLPAAIYNAIADALTDPASPHRSPPDLAFPLTAPVLWAALPSKEHR
jgi:carbon-monoxide dehydrogenase large subunit